MLMNQSMVVFVNTCTMTNSDKIPEDISISVYGGIVFLVFLSPLLRTATTPNSSLLQISS